MSTILGLELTTILTVVSILLLWCKPDYLWKISYAVTIGVGLFIGSFEVISLVTVICLYLLLQVYTNNKKYSLIALIGLLLLGVALALHVVPGFNNHEFISSHTLNESVASFTVWFNYDKSLFGILVMGLVFKSKLISSFDDLKLFLKTVLPILLIGLPVIYISAIAMGYVRLDVTFTSIFLPWALKNLFFTVLAEEILFRGLIQTELQKRLPKKNAALLSISIAGVLFGIAHFAGGLNYVILSTIAGFVYGYAYYKTQRIEASIAAHFLLNAGHFLFFSYPYLV